MAKKKVEITTPEVVATPVAETPVTEVKPLFVKSEKITPKVNPFLAWLNSTLYVISNPKSEFEEMLRAWFVETSKQQAIQDGLIELQKRGYVNESFEQTPFGQKLALSGCSPTPNLGRLADTSFNTAAAMLFAADKALVERHGILENGISPGKDNKLCEAVKQVSNNLWNSLVTGGYIKEN